MPGANTQRTEFYYDGWQVVEERYDMSVAPAPALKRQFVYGIYIDEPLVMDVNGNSDGDCSDASGDAHYYYHNDALMSVVALSDASGNLVEAYPYAPYGAHVTITDGNSDGEVDFDSTDSRVALAASMFGNPYTFTGRRFDPESGLHYYRNRYYSCERGRFLSRDPIGIWEDASNFGNGYNYVGNRSPNWIDPFGLEDVVIITFDKKERDVPPNPRFGQRSRNIGKAFVAAAKKHAEMLAAKDARIEYVTENGQETIQRILNEYKSREDKIDSLVIYGHGAPSTYIGFGDASNDEPGMYFGDLDTCDAFNCGAIIHIYTCNFALPGKDEPEEDLRARIEAIAQKSQAVVCASKGAVRYEATMYLGFALIPTVLPEDGMIIVPPPAPVPPPHKPIKAPPPNPKKEKM